MRQYTQRQVVTQNQKKGMKQIPEDRISSYLNRSTLIDTQSSFKLNKRLNENTAREGNGNGKAQPNQRHHNENENETGNGSETSERHALHAKLVRGPR